MNIASLHPNLRIRIGVGFVNRLLDSMITTFMAIYLAASYGVAAAGMLVFAVVSLGVLGMLAGGQLATTRGRRWTLLFAESLACASFALMAAGNSLARNTLVVYAGFLLAKLGSSLALPANDAMIVDVTTPAQRKEVYTINYWMTNLALAIGGLVGGFLYHGHFTVLLGVCAGATGGVLATTLWLLRETKPAQSDPAPRARPARDLVLGYRAVAGDRTFLRFVVAATLGLAIEFQLVNYVGVRMSQQLPAQRLGGSGGWGIRVDGVEMLGILRAENTALVVLLALFSQLIFRRLPDRVRLYGGVGLFAGGYMVLAVSNAGWLILLAGLVFTVGELMNVPVKQSLLADIVPQTDRPRYLAVYNLSIRISQMIASLCITLGAILHPWGMAGLYGILGVVIILQYRAVLASRRPAEPAEPAARPALAPANA